MNWLTTIIAILPFVFFFVWLVFAGLRSIDCSTCGNRLSCLQSPLRKTKRQWIEGGYRCENCGSEYDLSGNKIASEQPPRLRAILPDVAVIAVAVTSAILLLLALVLTFVLLS